MSPEMNLFILMNTLSVQIIPTTVMEYNDFLWKC